MGGEWPTNSPTDSPTKYLPTSPPTTFALVSKSWHTWPLKLGICEGHCRKNSDCADGLYCFQRSYPGNQAVPGCVSGGSGDVKYMGYCVANQRSETIIQRSGSHRMLSNIISPTQSVPPNSNNICNNDVTRQVTVRIRTDRNPGDISWEIVSTLSNIPVMSGGSYSSRNEVYETTMDLLECGYSFRIMDSYGDGLDCNADYTIFVDGRKVLFGNGNYGFSETKSFEVNRFVIPNEYLEPESLESKPNLTSEKGSRI